MLRLGDGEDGATGEHESGLGQEIYMEPSETSGARPERVTDMR